MTHPSIRVIAHRYVLVSTRETYKVTSGRIRRHYNIIIYLHKELIDEFLNTT